MATEYPPTSQPPAPDHQSQFEELLSHIWRCERWARIDDRIDLAQRLELNRQRVRPPTST